MSNMSIGGNYFNVSIPVIITRLPTRSEYDDGDVITFSPANKNMIIIPETISVFFLTSFNIYPDLVCLHVRFKNKLWEITTVKTPVYNFYILACDGVHYNIFQP